MEGGDGKWEVVQRRERKQGGHRKLTTTTYFFKNFPESCSVERLRQKFEEAGKVVDIFIPAKRDRSGKRFGFVRFEGAEACNERLEKLNNTWIDSFVIRAFIPRFPRPTEDQGEGIRRGSQMGRGERLEKQGSKKRKA